MTSEPSGGESRPGTKPPKNLKKYANVIYTIYVSKYYDWIRRIRIRVYVHGMHQIASNKTILCGVWSKIIKIKESFTWFCYIRFSTLK